MPKQGLRGSSLDLRPSPLTAAWMGGELERDTVVDRYHSDLSES
jgi:hypothetical protein